MDQEFKRNHIISVLTLIAGIMTTVAAILKFSMGNPAGFISMVAAIIFLGQATWLFLTPLIHIKKDSIDVNAAMFKAWTFQRNNLKPVTVNEGLVTFQCRLGEVRKVNLKMMAKGDRESFQEALQDLQSTLQN